MTHVFYDLERDQLFTLYPVSSDCLLVHQGDGMINTIDLFKQTSDEVIEKLINSCDDQFPYIGEL